MPVYEYKCQCGLQFERVLKIAQCDEPQRCNCGKPAEFVFSAPVVRGDLPSYNCPITGKLIDGRKAHEKNMDKHQCRILEPGERENVIKKKAAEETRLDKEVDATVEAFVDALPSQKREALAAEVMAGADVNVVRN